jgi:16S rRNA (guanine1516-N2)-methyltransferase
MPQHAVTILKSCLTTLPEEIADALEQLQFQVSDKATDDYYLSCDQDSVILYSGDNAIIKPVLRKPARFSGKQPLLRALSPARGGTIIDATAGLGDDTLKLAMVARHVHAIERSPVVFALLISALYKANKIPLAEAKKIEAHFGDAISLIEKLPAADIVYLDPMFPDKRKRSALPPKSVRVLRELVGGDPDTERLLAVARRHAKKRVVVKRPLHSNPLADDHVALHEGKVVRYEVYLPTH